MQKFWFTFMLVAVATVSSTGSSLDFDNKLVEAQIVNYRTDSRARRQVDSTDGVESVVDVVDDALPPLEIFDSTLEPVTLPTLPPVTPPTLPPVTLPTLPPVINTTIFNPNCTFIGLELSVVVNILDPLVCGKVLCEGNPECTHFTHDPAKDGGTCTLHKATDTSAPTLKGSTATCGHIPNRSCRGNALLSLCLNVGLNINLGALQALLPLLG